MKDDRFDLLKTGYVRNTTMKPRTVSKPTLPEAFLVAGCPAMTAVTTKPKRDRRNLASLQRRVIVFLLSHAFAIPWLMFPSMLRAMFRITAHNYACQYKSLHF